MREYAFVRIPYLRRRTGPVLERDYRDAIREQAAAGWSFVQAISFDDDARPHLDLVFTREDNKK